MNGQRLALPDIYGFFCLFVSTPETDGEKNSFQPQERSGMSNIIEVYTGTVLNSDVELSFKDLCHLCKVDPESVMEMINEGIIEPQGDTKNNWRFRGYEIRRIQVTLRLKKDLGVNTPGSALALDLMEEIERLRQIVS